MNIATAVNRKIDRIPQGRIFGYEAFPEYRDAPDAVLRAVCRRVDSGSLKRLQRGRFYKAGQGILGEISPGDTELLKDALYRNGRRIGYITGPALYNRMGLTTQSPKTITIASRRAPQTKDLGTIRIKFVPSRAPISDSTIELQEILDALREARSVPDASVGTVLNALANHMTKLGPAELRKLQQLAVKYYNAGTRALLGLLMSTNEQPVLPALKDSINPSTRFSIGIKPDEWPQARDWNIR